MSRLQLSIPLGQHYALRPVNPALCKQAGVGTKGDATKWQRDYGTPVCGVVELDKWLGLKNVSLKQLTEENTGLVL